MREKKLPLCRLSPLWALLLTVPLAAAETLLALYIQPGPLTALWASLTARPLALFLNFLPFWLLTLGGYFLFLNPFFSAALMGAVGGLLSMASRIMVEKRDEPLTPKDFGLIKEAGNALQDYSLSVDPGCVTALVGFVVVMLLLGVLVGGKRPFEKRGQNWCFRLLGAALAFGSLFGCIQGVYSSKELYNSFPVTNRSYITGVYQELGFPYCFCYNFNTYPVYKPEGYSTQKVLEYIGEHPEKRGDPKDVDVIIVMNEAFSDVTNFEAFDYPAGEEPLNFYNSLAEEPNAITGHLVVPNYGAGTANAEFDVVTGMQTNMIGESGSSAFRVLNHEMDSIFRVLREDGYQTEFLHPGKDWFYNRQNVYRYFGAEKLVFSEGFEGAPCLGSWVRDSAVLDKLTEEHRLAKSSGKPYFNYTVTIQNHMSYTEKKYGADHVSPEVPLKKEVSPEARTMLSVYAEGVEDADEMLQGLTEYYAAQEDPVLLVFFGDHRPNLGDNYLSYRELGMEIGEGEDPVTTLSTYETPYVVWVNDAAAQALDFQNAKEALDLPDDNTINANYLGAMTLELIGRRDQDAFFSFLNDLRRELPILHNGVGRTGDGTYFTQVPEEYAREVEKLRFWEYYRLKVE